MRPKRERIIKKARAKRRRKLEKRKPKPATKTLVPDLTAQVQEVASAVSGKIANLVDAATKSVKKAVTKKRFHTVKESGR